MSYNSEDNFSTCVGICVVLPPVVLLIGYIVLAVNAGIDKGFPTDLWGWLFGIALLIAIPFGYAFSVILPAIYGAVGLLVGNIVDKNEIENPMAIFLLCLLFDAIASALIYFIYTNYISGSGEDVPDPPLMKYERF